MVVMADVFVTEVVKNIDSTEQELWDALTTLGEDSVSYEVVDFLWGHPNCSDRIVMAYFTGQIPFDFDTIQPRIENCLGEEVFWADVNSALQLEGISLETRTAILKECFEYLTGPIRENILIDQASMLAYVDYSLPQGLLGEDMHYELVLDYALAPVLTLIEFIKVAHLENEYPERISALEEWRTASLQILKSQIWVEQDA